MLNIYFNGADTSIVFYSWYSTIKLVLKFYLTIEKVLKYEQPLTKSRCPDHPTNCNERGGGGGSKFKLFELCYICRMARSFITSPKLKRIQCIKYKYKYIHQLYR